MELWNLLSLISPHSYPCFLWEFDFYNIFFLKYKRGFVFNYFVIKELKCLTIILHQPNIIDDLKRIIRHIFVFYFKHLTYSKADLLIELFDLESDKETIILVVSKMCHNRQLVWRVGILFGSGVLNTFDRREAVGDFVFIVREMRIKQS